jgi:phospholipid/cholesterol/gamma-HCH transport system permease protein
VSTPKTAESGSWFAEQAAMFRNFFEHIGRVSLLAVQTFKTLFGSRFDFTSFVYQLEQLGVRSFMIAAATAVFVGIVMTIQFAFFAERYGAQDSLPRIIVLSEARELAPALTSLVVGCRIAAGMAAELGSMAVTEQIDAIRALGADPIRKLVVPRVLAAMTVMPLMCCVAFLLGMLSSMMVCAVSFGLSPGYFYSTAISTVGLGDLWSGFAKTPCFGLIIGLIGCYFGIGTRGGTEGVGRSTTSAVVAAAITLLIADALLTQVFVSIG